GLVLGGARAPPDRLAHVPVGGVQQPHAVTTPARTTPVLLTLVITPPVLIPTGTRRRDRPPRHPPRWHRCRRPRRHRQHRPRRVRRLHRRIGASPRPRSSGWPTQGTGTARPAVWATRAGPRSSCRA